MLGSIVLSGAPSLQFLGDTGNVAARLQELSKELAATAVISLDVFTAAEWEAAHLRLADVVVRGRGEEALRVAAVADIETLRPMTAGPKRMA